MKIGMPTLVEYNSIEENVKLAKKSNLDFIELNLDLPYCKINSKLKKYNIEFTVHISENCDIGVLNNNLRRFYLKQIEKTIANGIKYNINKYNIHIDNGIYFTLPEGKVYINDKYKSIYLKAFEDSCKKLNEIAKKYKVYINFENTKINDVTKDSVKIIEKYEYLNFTLDIGHNEKNNNIAYEIFNKKRIIHLHIHDYDGTSDHIEIGTGIIDFNKYRDLIEKHYCVIEVKKSEELINSINIFNRIFIK